MKSLLLRKAAEREPTRYEPRFDSWLDDFFSPFSLAPREFGAWSAEASFVPRVDVHETDASLTVTAELPGIDEKEVAVELEENSLILSGEKREEHEEKTRHGYRLERHFGSFHRIIPLPARVEGDKAKAVFRKGVLTVTIPKTEACARKRIDIKNG